MYFAPCPFVSIPLSSTSCPQQGEELCSVMPFPHDVLSHIGSETTEAPHLQIPSMLHDFENYIFSTWSWGDTFKLQL